MQMYFVCFKDEMPARKRQRTEVVEDSDESDIEAELELQALQELQQHNSTVAGEDQDDIVDDKDEDDITNLLNMIEEMKSEVEDMPWIETVTVTAPSFVIEDVDDDLNRETLFYNLTVESIKLGRKLLNKAGVSHRRPDDFFAEMLKSDDHMKKVSTHDYCYDYDFLKE